MIQIYGCSTVEEAVLKIKQVRDMHRQGSFEILNWPSKSPDVLEAVGSSAWRKQKHARLKDKKSWNECWDSNRDVFKFNNRFGTKGQ